MITHIHIQNFTIIDRLDLEIPNGMIVLTGETGAGKSIVIDAMELALGKRANSDVIRNKENQASISITCDITHNVDAHAVLETYAIPITEDCHCLIRRVIEKDGRSKNYINGTPATLQMLRTLSDTLINIHGQHEFQTLLKREEQRRIVDRFAGQLPLLNSVNALYEEWKNIQNALASHAQQNNTQRIDFLNYQIQELEGLHVTEIDIHALETEHHQLIHAEELMQQCQNAYAHLQQETDEPAALPLLHAAQQAIFQARKFAPSLSPVTDTLQQATIHLEDAAHTLQDYMQSFEWSPERLTELDRQISKIHDLARKHRVEPEALPELLRTLQTELHTITQSDAHIEKLQARLQELEQTYRQQASELSAQRKKTAHTLSTAITKHMQQLGMPHGQLKITVEPVDTSTPCKHGLDTITFLVAPNPGQPLQPLTKIASGGELSRISLAIQAIAAAKNQTPTLIFDEVDIGIGGATAEIVGTLLRKLATNTQVLCITHLAQVAAQGTHHLHVEKISDAQNTRTQIISLTASDRVQELARMSGGLNITQRTLAHAKEMLESQPQISTENHDE